MTEAITKSPGEIVVCDACPVLCRIRPGKTGACDRYANVEGVLTRTDPMVLAEASDVVVPFFGEEWDGNPVPDAPTFLTGIGSGTTYPDYKPAPFIVASRHRGVDVITVVTEAIFSYCGVKVKIDTDRYVGPEQAPVRAGGEQVGHVTTAEYGSQMLALGGVRHLTVLARFARMGRPAALVFCAQRGDVTAVRADADIDPLFARALRAAATGRRRIRFFSDIS